MSSQSVIKYLGLSALAAYATGGMVQVASALPSDIVNPLDKTSSSANNTDLRSGVVSILNYFLGFLGLVAVIVIIIAGVKLVTSQGNDTSVKSAQKTILYAALGLLLVFFAYAIVTFVTNLVA